MTSNTLPPDPLYDKIVSTTQRLYLQLWATDTHTNYWTMNKKLRCLSGLNLAGTTKRFLDEAYGDALLCEDICHRCSTRISALVDTVKSAVVKTHFTTKSFLQHNYYIYNYGRQIHIQTTGP